MQFRFLALGGVLGLVGAAAQVSAATQAISFPLFLQEEDVPLVTNYTASSNLYQITTSGPVLCANTPDPAVTYPHTGGSINPVYPNFVFGPYSVPVGSGIQQPVQTPSQGLTNVQYKTSLTPASYIFQADSTLGTPPLVCYVTDSNGVRKLTRDYFRDGFDHDYTPGAAPDIYDSSVTLTAEDAINQPPGYFQYYVDVNIPTPAQSATFVLRDGFNTRVFNTTGGGWCQAASTTDTTCPVTNPPTALTPGDINFTQTLNSSSLPTQVRFIVYRQYNSSDTHPQPGELVTLAALFSPENIVEVPLGNNVSSLVQPIPQ